MGNGRRIDTGSIRFAKEAVDSLYPNLPPAITSETEDFGWDLKQGSNLWEVKTNRFKDTYDEWYQLVGTENVKTAMAPPIDFSMDFLRDCQEREPECFPTKRELDDAPVGKRKKTKFFPLNVTGYDYRVEGSKWWKITHEPNSNLMIIFPDGVLIFDHDTLIKAATFYGWIKTGMTEHFGGGTAWQLKIFLNTEMGEFHPMDVPDDAFPKKEF